MGIQWFDAIAAKFFAPGRISAAPTLGMYQTSDGGIGFAVGGVQVQKFGGTTGNAGPAATALTANGAISVSIARRYVITKAGVLAATLAAPAADNLEINIISDTANAHTLTATGLLATGSAAVDVATFAAFAGAGLTLRSYGGTWAVVSSVGITFS